MTEDQINAFQSGYWECRRVILRRLQEIIADTTDYRESIESLVERLDADEKREIWESIQRLAPGITTEEYEAGIEIDAKAIRGLIYSSSGFLKPQLVKSQD